MCSIHVSKKERSAPLNCVDNGDSKSGNDTNQKRGHNTSHGDCQAPAVDGRKRLTSDNAADRSPAYLHDQVKDTSDL